MEMIAISKKPLYPSYSKIESEAEKQIYWDSLLKDWNLPKHIKHFPGSHPISIEEKDLDFIRDNKEDYLASLKSDGVRYIMYMTFRPGLEDSPITLLIDRAQNMYEIEVWANMEYYYGTILDGELVWKLPDETQSTYLVFDVIKLKGVMKSNISYKERLECINSIIFDDNIRDGDVERIELLIEECDKIVSMNNLNNLIIKSKNFAPIIYLEKIWNDRKTSLYRNDGLILTKNNNTYKHGSDRSTFKWKPTCSIDVIINSGNVLCNSNSSSELVKITKILDRPIFLEKNKLDYNKNQIVECDIKINNKKISLFPMRTRIDKSTPNTLKTIESSVKGVLQNIPFERLKF